MAAVPEFPHTRWSLVARIGHDRDSLADLLSLYAPAIGRYLAQKLPQERSRGSLDDVVQETLVELLERPDLLARARPAEGRRFRYLVMTSAYFLARNALRRLQRPGQRERSGTEGPSLAATEDPAPAAIADMDRAWAAGVIARSWDDVRAWAESGQLEPGGVDLLYAHLTEQRSLRDLARVHGLSLASCQRRIARGRLLLQRAIHDRLRAANELEDGMDPVAAYDVLVGLIAAR